MFNFFINKFYFIDKFEINNIKNLDKRTSVIYRNYNKNLNTKEILKIRAFCKSRSIKFYFANNLKLAIKFNCDGVYIPSFNRSIFIKGKMLKKNFKILGSAHNIHEIKQKEIQGVEILFISSIFKRNKNYLGINKFKFLKNFTKKRIVALGGINNDNIKKIKQLEIDGFAGISFFKKKPPQKN